MGLGFFGKGLRFSSSVSDCLSDGYAIFGEGEFFREVEIFSGRGLNFFGSGGDAFGSVWDFFGRDWDYFRGVEFVHGI